MTELKTVLKSRVRGDCRAGNPPSFCHRSMYRQQRRGAMAVLCAVSLVVLLAVAALIVDVAWMSVIQTEAQVASDLATRSALTAYMFDQSDENFERRKLRAQHIGELVFESSTIGQTSVDLDEIEISLGVQTTEGNFTEDQDFVNAAFLNLPQVSENGFGLLLAPMFGHEIFNPSARSKAAFTPIDVVLCVDISRSMAWRPNVNKAPGNKTIHQPPLAGSRWLLTVDSINSFLDKAEVQVPSLRAGMITLGGGVRVKVDTPWDDGEGAQVEADLDLIGQVRSHIDSRLDFISDNTLGWRTPTLEALNLTHDLLEDQSGPAVQRLVILLSDGADTTGDPLPAAEKLADAGITIHTIYFAGGNPEDGNRLARLSDEAGGLALNPDNAVELDQAFDQILALLSVQMIE